MTHVPAPEHLRREAERIDAERRANAGLATLSTAAYLGGTSGQGQGASADVCLTCGALLPPFRQGLPHRARHAAWHEAQDVPRWARDAARAEVARLRGPFEAGVRQAIDWLRADYPSGSGPDWREDGCEWIAERLAEYTTALAAATPTDEASPA